MVAEDIYYVYIKIFFFLFVNNVIKEFRRKNLAI